MNFFKSTQIGVVSLLVFQIVILSGCGEYRKLTNDPPKITSFIVPSEVKYGETVEFKSRVFDPENDPLTYTWDVSDGTLIGEAGPEVQWTAPELPPEEVVPPVAVTVYLYVRDGGEEDVRKLASIIVYSKTYKIVQALSGTYTLVSKEVRGVPVEETGVLRLTTTTFTTESQSIRNGSGDRPKQFVSGSYRLVEPFDDRKGGIHWFADGSQTPTIGTYTWDGKLFIIFWPATSTRAVYEK